MNVERTPLAILVAASNKINQGWTQRATARDAEGRPVLCADTEAPVGPPVCYCTYGAALFSAYEAMGLNPKGDAMPMDAWREAHRLTDTAIEYLHEARAMLEPQYAGQRSNDSIGLWNDHPAMSKERVLAVYAKAIALCPMPTSEA